MLLAGSETGTVASMRSAETLMVRALHQTNSAVSASDFRIVLWVANGNVPLFKIFKGLFRRTCPPCHSDIPRDDSRIRGSRGVTDDPCDDR